MDTLWQRLQQLADSDLFRNLVAAQNLLGISILPPKLQLNAVIPVPFSGFQDAPELSLLVPDIHFWRSTRKD